MIKGIVCVASDWGIGKANGLLFNLPSDMKFFRETTKHNIIVMGYSTYLSLPKRPLPNRINIVLWDKAISLDCLDGAITFSQFDKLLNFVKILATQYDVFISGGASIYRLFLPYYDEILVTYVNKSDPEATAFFPNLDTNASYYVDKVLACIQENGYELEFRKYKQVPKIAEMERSL